MRKTSINESKKCKLVAQNFHSIGTYDEMRNAIKVLEYEIAEVDVGRRMRKAEDAVNGHPMHAAASPTRYLCPLRRTEPLALRSLL